MKNLRKRNEKQGDGSRPIRPMSISMPTDVADTIIVSLPRGQRSGFIWRATLFVLALTTSEPVDMKVTLDDILDKLSTDEASALGDRLVKASGICFREVWRRRDDSQ